MAIPGVRQTDTTPYRWVIEAVLLLMQVAIGLNFLAPAPLFPLIMEEYGLDRGTVSLLVAAVTIMLAVFTLPAGLVVARIGLRPALGVGGLLMGAGVLVPVAASFPALLLLRIAFGIGAGVAFPATSAVVMQWFKPRELPLINGLNFTGQSVGVAASMFISVPLAEAFGWQFPLSLYGALTLAAATAWVMFGRRSQTGAAPTAPLALRDILAVLKERTTLLLQLAVVGPFAMSVGFSAWLPTYYNEALGMPLARASSIAGLLPLVGIFATVFGGVMPTRLGLRKPFLVLPGMLIAFGAFGSFLFDNAATIYGAVILLGICSWVYLPALFTIPMEIPGTSPEKVAVVIAGALALGNLAAFASPIMVGATADVTGSYVPGLSVLAALSVTLLIAGLLLPETGPNSAKGRPRLKPLEMRNPPV